MNKIKNIFKTPWAWVPSLYYAQGIPYVVVMTVAVIMYKRLGVSNSEIALYTSWLYLPWVIKPLWSPIVDIFKTKRSWIIFMQLIVGASLAGVAFTIPMPNFLQYTLAFFWLLAFSSATHDIAADGFYMLALDKHEQAFFVGIRSTFYRIAMITGQGILIIFAGYFETTTGLPPVDLSINAITKNINHTEQIFNPNSISITQSYDKLNLVLSKSNINISTIKNRSSNSDSILQYIKSWNVQKGFTIDENINISSNNSKKELSDIELFIKNTFGESIEKKSSDFLFGNIGINYIHLSKEPDDNEDIIVNIGKSSGDESIKLVEGSRLVFNKTNWNIPAFLVFQLDPKLKKESNTIFQARSGNIPLSWTITFIILTVLFFIFFIYHKFILPHPSVDKPTINNSGNNPINEFFKTFALFFKKKKIGLIIAFLLFFRLGESQLVKMASPFLLDSKEIGGLGLTTGEAGLVYGTVGILALTLGGLLGGVLAAKDGLKKWLWWMLLAINIPNAVYIYMAYSIPESFLLINLLVAVEQFGYGFGFTAYMLYMIYSSEGNHKTAHFAIATGFMALGMMLPGMISGWIQELIGYKHFFIWVLLATIPSFIITKFIPLESDFGKKNDEIK